MVFNNNHINMVPALSHRERLYYSNISLKLSILTVSEGKRMVGRIIGDSENINIFKKYCKKLGLKFYIHRKRLHSNSYGPCLFFSKKIEHIRSALYYHYIHSGWVENTIALGRLYGYPHCCFKFFLRNKKLMEQEKDYELKMNIIQASKQQLLPIYTNNFGYFLPVFHHVCSYNCQDSVEIGKDHLAILKGYSKRLYQRLIKELELCIIILKKQCLFIRDFSFDDRKVEFSLEYINKKEELRFFKMRGSQYSIEFNKRNVRPFIFCLH